MAATILPFSSEVAFVAALKNDMSFLNAMIFASCGNVLAIILNYWLGYWLYEKTKTKLGRSKSGIKSLEYGHKHGYFILLFTWLPVIGDPLTLVAGVLRLKFVWFVIVAGTLRVARYYFLGLVV
ncbi:YqaA family protein [Sulfurimonas sp.]|uniref:YqaA family protein n=1 Tax=Sulfurimonas sp. TaxID=2022749 RepID=UPI003569B79B